MSVAVVQSVVMALLALMFTGVWLRSREPGTWLLGLGFAAAAAWYGFSDLAPNSGPDIDTGPEHVSSVAVLLTILLRAAGVAAYLGLPRGGVRHLFVAGLVAPLCILVWLLAGQVVSHGTFHVIGLLPYVGAAAVAFHAAHREPGNGLSLLGAALLLLPALPYVLARGGIDPSTLKHYTGTAVIAYGLLLLTVSLLRRQRALVAEVARRTAAEAQLRDLADRLESRVNERTAHLRELIGGLESFTRGVSHDLRGPLEGMSQLARMAAESLRSGDASLAQQALPRIAEQCDASTRMVNAMLELARVGEQPAQPVPVALRQVVEAAVDEVLLSHAQLRPEQIAVGPMHDLEADPVLLRTALVNLLANAVKFAGPSAQVEVSSRRHGQDIELNVRDNGPGFPPELASRLFEPFYRVPGTAQAGHGLGLSLTRRAVEAMGGEVRAAARPEGGADIGFVLHEAALVGADVPTPAAGKPTEPLAPSA